MTRAIVNQGKRYKAFIFISCVVENNWFTQTDFRTNSIKQPFLIIHADKDRRIPLSYIEKFEKSLRFSKHDVTVDYYVGEDHFLFFSKRTEICDSIGQFLEKCQKGSETAPKIFK